MKSKGKKKFSFWRLMRNIIVGFFVVSIVWVGLDRFLPVYLTPLMIIRSFEAIGDGHSPKNDKTWVPIEKISPNMVQAVVASEDNKFLFHHGFSFDDMSRAFEHNMKGKRIRGGSTISQQTAKNVFLFPNRSYIRKGLEAYFTVLIELLWGKERIMEMYLNVIEMGDGIYGIEAASQAYFNKPASDLTKSQAALIAACLPNPRKYNAGDPSAFIKTRKSKIVSVMAKLPKVDFDNPKEPGGKKKRKK